VNALTPAEAKDLGLLADSWTGWFIYMK
jgi:hypothetical protein